VDTFETRPTLTYGEDFNVSTVGWGLQPREPMPPTTMRLAAGAGRGGSAWLQVRTLRLSMLLLLLRVIINAVSGSGCCCCSLLLSVLLLLLLNTALSAAAANNGCQCCCCCSLWLSVLRLLLLMLLMLLLLLLLLLLLSWALDSSVCKAKSRAHVVPLAPHQLPILGSSKKRAGMNRAASSTAAAVITLTTYGSDFDTVLMVYTGTLLKKLARVVTNDDCDTTVQHSCVRFKGTPGVAYSVQVTSAYGETGRLVVAGNVVTPRPMAP
jgi:hypothetical protein